MSDSYTKLFRGITTSTIVGESLATRWLWVTMLASCDRKGVVYGSVPGLARLANISIDECVDGLNRLMSPDQWSRSKDHEGRRLAEIDGGWLILNHAKYDAMRSADEAAARKREWDRENRPSGHARAKSVAAEQTGSSPTQSDDSPQQSAKVRSPLALTPALSPTAEQDQEHLPRAIADAIDSGPATVIPNAVLSMPTTSGGEAAIVQTQVDTWSDAYPGIDVVAELRKARAWLISNPTRGKTARGIPRFCNAWLEKAQNDGNAFRRTTGPPQRGHTESKTGAFLRTLDEAMDQLENDDGKVVCIGHSTGPALVGGPRA